MRIILQSVRSKFYFRRGNTWTAHPESAFDFETSEAIQRFIRERGFRDVQIMLNTEAPERCEPVNLDRLEQQS
jgi:hypothetical protein